MKRAFGSTACALTLSLCLCVLIGCGSSSAGGSPIQVASISGFVASSPTITAGSSTSLVGHFANGTGIITPGNIAVTDGVPVTVSPKATTTYTLTVTPSTGTAVSQVATITVTQPPPVTAQNQVTVNQSSLGPVVSDKILGMNMAAWYDPTTPGIVPAFAAAGIKSVRWPGGSWADGYNWQNNTECGGGPNPSATWTNFVNQLAVPAGLDIALIANYGANATCDGPGDAAIAAAWVANALANKINVTHVTVGNEEYGSWEIDNHSTPHSAAQYARVTATEFYPQIKAANPKMLVGVDVNPGDSTGWDPTVLGNALYDFVEFHYYAETPAQESDSFLVGSAAQELTRQINLIKAELVTVGKPDTPIYLGEVGGPYSNPGKQSWSITQGLYAGQVLGEMMNDGVQRLTWWIGFGNCNGQAGNNGSSLYAWQNFGAYNVFSDGPSDTNCSGGGPMGTMSPTARAFQLFSSVAVSGEHVLTASVQGDTANLRAYAATNPNGGTALVLFNLNQTLSETVAVTLSAQTTASTVTVESYDKSIYDQTNAAAPVWASPTTTTINSPTLPLTLTLTPWSMNVVMIH